MFRCVSKDSAAESFSRQIQVLRNTSQAMEVRSGQFALMDILNNMTGVACDFQITILLSEADLWISAINPTSGLAHFLLKLRTNSIR
jgi:hypothetical protein